MRATAHEPETIRISEVRTRLNTLVNTVYREHTRVVVEKSGIPVAALVSIDDLERLERLDRERETRFAVIDEMREAFNDVPEEEIERETDRILGTDSGPVSPTTI
jgi:prevent-host-death family protein